MDLNRKLKLCFLAAGNTPHSYRWIEFFSDRGQEIHWVSLVPFSDPIPKEIKAYELLVPRGRKLNNLPCIIIAIIRLKKLLKKIKPDLLHIHSVGTYGLIGSLVGFHPLFATAWGSDVLITGKSLLKGLFVRHALHSSDLVTCDADHMRRAMMKMGVQEDNIRTVYFGTDTCKFQPAPKSKTLRRQLGADDRPIVISMRSLEPIYNLESFIRAIPFVLERFPDAVFIIVSDGSQRGYLERLAKSLATSRNVKFIGPVPTDRLAEYFTSADIYVSTSLSDAGLSGSAAEAMACGLPVVMTDSGENRLWVEEGKGGFVVPCKDPTALSERILYLLQNPNQAREFGLFNRKIIEERNNYHVEMAKIEKLYYEVVRSYGKS